MVFLLMVVIVLMNLMNEWNRELFVGLRMCL